MNWLVRLGSRVHVVGEIAALILLVKSCAAAPVVTGPGGGGAGGETSTGGEGGMPDGGTGGATGGQAGSTSSGGMGGSGGATGGATGGTGGCEPTFACGPKDCGMVDNGCGVMLDCDHQQPGDPVTCATESGGETGPMTCGADHVCECPAEGNSPAAMALCEGAAAEPAVDAWCASQGGCDTALCGTPPVAKVPGTCIYGGAKADETQVWCCAKPQS